VNAAVIKHGSINIVTVKQGQAGISYDGGTLNVLPTGRHHLTASSQLFAGFLSLGQQVLKISQVVSMTSDNVGICFDAGGLARLLLRAAGAARARTPPPLPSCSAISIQVGRPVQGRHDAVPDRGRRARALFRRANARDRSREGQAGPVRQ